VDGTGKVLSAMRQGNALLLQFEAAPEIMRYVVEKGFVAVDGASLTVASRDATSFTVSLVEYTRQHSVLGQYQAEDMVNLEVDIIAKYVEQFIHPPSTLTMEFLQEHGFLNG
jgi:riboflavin synthase